MTVSQLWVQTDAYNAADDRLLLAAMLPAGAAGPLGSAVGLRDATDLVLTVTGGGLTGTVSRGAAFISFGGSIYLLASNAVEPVTFGPVDPTNARIDILVAQVHDPEAGGAAGNAQVRIIPGAPSLSPVAPAVPDGALLLNTLRFNAGVQAPINTRNAGPFVPIQRLPPRGFLARTAQAGNQDVSTGVNLVTTSVTLTESRRLRVFGFFNGNQISIASQAVNVTITGPGLAMRIGAGPIALNLNLTISGNDTVIAPPGVYTAYIFAQSNQGALRITPNSVVLSIVDEGPA